MRLPKRLINHMRLKRSATQAGFVEIAMMGAGALGMVLSVGLLALNSAREKSRDAKRVADVRQLASALELYRNDYNRYPDTLQTLEPRYIGKVPVAPNPHDGTGCTVVTNMYQYTKTGNTSFNLVFCLGGPTAGYQAGVRILTEKGIE